MQNASCDVKARGLSYCVRHGLPAQWLRGKSLQAIPSKGSLFNNLILTAVISPRMHNTIVKFNNKRNRMTSRPRFPVVPVESVGSLTPPPPTISLQALHHFYFICNNYIQPTKNFKNTHLTLRTMISSTACPEKWFRLYQLQLVVLGIVQLKTTSTSFIALWATVSNPQDWHYGHLGFLSSNKCPLWLRTSGSCCCGNTSIIR